MLFPTSDSEDKEEDDSKDNNYDRDETPETETIADGTNINKETPGVDDKTLGVDEKNRNR